ncbi:MAG TPA: MutS family DNA mismatch repair protein [Gemmatimonadaceae bacterium]|nr:MutS family DNA mismatch repair protein [Gemmatimonadaceae bacterium]
MSTVASSPAPPSSSPAEQTPADPLAYYQGRAEWHARHAAESTRRARWMSHLRLVVFVLLVLAGSWAAATVPPVRPFAIAVAVLIAAAFVVLVVLHRRARERVGWHEQLRAVSELGERRVRRAWSELPALRVGEAPPAHPYAADLDVVGHASLFRLLDVVSAAPGRPTLLGWLLEPTASAPVVRERQTAAGELAARTELREELHALARMTGEVRPESLERFLQWADDTPWLLRQPVLLWTARVVPVILLAVLVLGWLGLVPWVVLLLPLLAELVVLSRASTHLRSDIARAAAYGAGLNAIAEMLGSFSRATFTAPLLARLQQHCADGGGAHRQLHRLERVLAWAEVRYSPMLHGVLQFLLLWDVHVVARLERWRVDAGAQARVWLSALGEMETLAALGTLAHDNPEWSFPDIREDGVTRIDARALAHPLLPSTARVANDVTVGPRGTSLLITGSNMSGKSTLLRAIGANVVLAQAGAPVCAASLSLPLVSPYTSIRVADSLEQGISLFMAELMRLKQIVDAARNASAERPLLYLLDEILHGTNTAERQVAARTVLGTLIESGAIGAVTTHDLTLAADGVLARAARPVHFSEHFTRGAEGTTMTFDYRLRPGLATSANALKLLEMMGLGEG